MPKNSSFQTIQFSTISQFSSIGSIERILSCATTPGQSGPGSDGNEEELCIPQSSSITDCLFSYPEHSLEEPYSSTKMQSEYSAAPADRAKSSLTWHFPHLMYQKR